MSDDEGYIEIEDEEGTVYRWAAIGAHEIDMILDLVSNGLGRGPDTTFL